VKTFENIDKIYHSEFANFESDLVSDSKANLMWESVSKKIDNPIHESASNNTSQAVKVTNTKTTFFSTSNVLLLTSTTFLAIAATFFVIQSTVSPNNEQNLKPLTETVSIETKANTEALIEIKETPKLEKSIVEKEITEPSKNKEVTSAVEKETVSEIIDKTSNNTETIKHEIPVNVEPVTTTENTESSVESLIEIESKTVHKQVVIKKEVIDTVKKVQKLRIDPRKYKGKKRD